jgi:hypothetical protein
VLAGALADEAAARVDQREVGDDSLERGAEARRVGGEVVDDAVGAEGQALGGVQREVGVVAAGGDRLPQRVGLARGDPQLGVGEAGAVEADLGEQRVEAEGLAGGDHRAAGDGEDLHPRRVAAIAAPRTSAHRPTNHSPHWP